MSKERVESGGLFRRKNMAEIVHASDKNQLSIKNGRKQRDAGPELLRIFAMFLIIMSHLAVHGGIEYSSLSVNSAALEMMKTGNIGVDIFILISGYYSIYSSPKLKKGIMLICQTLFYSVALLFIVGIFNPEILSKKHLICALLPFISEKGNWFIVVYILMYALIPFINGGLKNLSKRMFFGLLLLIFFASTLLPDTFGRIMKLQDYGISRLVWFVFMYSLGAYLRLYPVKLAKKRGLCAVLWVMSALFAMLFRYFYADVMYNDAGNFKGIKGIIIYFFSDISRPGFMSVVFSVLSLLFFTSLKIKGNKFLFAVSGSTFGVYLIHDSEWMRRFLWDVIAPVKTVAESDYFILVSIAVILLIFIACSAVDIIRKNFIEKPLFNSSIYSKAENALKQIVDKALVKVGL